MGKGFFEVTEIAGDEVTGEQVDRIFNRYCWAKDYCYDKDVLEVACGSGQGLGLLKEVSKSLEAGDYSSDVLNVAKEYYQDRVSILKFDAQNMPYRENSFDVVIIFEAIYYLPNFIKFIIECKKVLKSNGKILISVPNNLLSDFNKSPHSFDYFNIKELNEVLEGNGFDTVFFGYMHIAGVSFRQRILRPIKSFVVSSGLMPKTMAGKKFFKRLVFGSLVKMPHEVTLDDCKKCNTIDKLNGYNSEHKVIYCEATLKL